MTVEATPVPVPTTIEAYAIREDADTYFANNVFADAWKNATVDRKDTSLAHATKIIDRLRFKGNPTTTQDHSWPRILWRNGPSVTPQEIADACCEIALSLLKGVDPEKEFLNMQIKSQQYGTLRTDKDTTMCFDCFAAGVPSMAAWQLLLPYLANQRELRLQHS